MGLAWDELRYGGLTKEQFESIEPAIVKNNFANLRFFAPIGSAAFCVLLVACQFSAGPASSNSLVYMNSCIACGVITALTHVFGKNHPRLVRPLMWAFATILYAFAVSLSMVHPEYPAVSAIVFLMVVPLLFVERPITVVCVTMAYVAVVCVMSAMLKTPVIAEDDAWNAVTFGVVSMVEGIFIEKMRLLSLYQEREIVRLSRFDTLTRLKNRKCYEEELRTHLEMDAQTLACVFIDVNGLHELNNTRGHDAGDVMLCTVAEGIRSNFDEMQFYRIGGDEFVGFVPDVTVEQVWLKLEDLQVGLSSKGYSVSCGVHALPIADITDMRLFVRDAEQDMYEHKRAYYMASNHDRRRRRDDAAPGNHDRRRRRDDA